MSRKLGCAIAVALASFGLGSDHNNVDKERPLRFDDAYSIAYRAFEFQNGVRLDSFRGRRPVYNFRSELQYGFAKNKDISIGFEPLLDTGAGRLLGNVAEISYFEGLQREIDNSPAFGYRLDAGLPLSGGAGMEVRLRGILTKTVGALGRVHLNFDQYLVTAPAAGFRRNRTGAIVGYSVPLGYPTQFDRTFLAELGVEESPEIGRGMNSWVGVGIRRQLSPTGVLDIGVQLDLRRGDSQSLSPLRLTIGFSTSF